MTDDPEAVDGGRTEADDDEARRARVRLSYLVEPDDAPLMAVIAACGPFAVWRSAVSKDTGRLVAATGGDGRVAAALVRLAGRADAAPPVEQAFAAGRAAGARLLCPGDDEWPDALGALGPSQPLCLWARGPARLDAATERAVAIVGARAATGYGQHVAGDLAYGVAARGWTVISGGAYGIDGAAHRGAIAAGTPTIAVLACGVDVAYPRGHTALLASIAEDGLVISEWPPGCAPLAHRFLTRNRLIAALSAGTVVVEAAVRSGAKSTANLAAQLGRDVMAVPGPVTSAMSTGCHQLLRDGAICVTSAAEVLDLVGAFGGDLAEDRAAAPDRRDGLPVRIRRVLEAVPVFQAAAAARISRPAAQPVADVREALAVLEVAGFVERRDDGYRLSADERARLRAGRTGS